MTPEVEATYPKIGQELVDRLPEDFQVAWIRVEMTDDASSVGIFHSQPDGKIYYTNKNVAVIDDLFFQMRDAFKASGLAPWSMATFRLTGEGKMEIDFGYDDVSDFGLGPERRKDWIRNHLGSNPDIVWPK